MRSSGTRAAVSSRRTGCSACQRSTWRSLGRIAFWVWKKVRTSVCRSCRRRGGICTICRVKSTTPTRCRGSEQLPANIVARHGWWIDSRGHYWFNKADCELRRGWAIMLWMSEKREEGRGGGRKYKRKRPREKVRARVNNNQRKKEKEEEVKENREELLNRSIPSCLYFLSFFLSFSFPLSLYSLYI